MQRRLAAILAADVAGYTRLMGQDEVGTLARLTRLRREVIEPLIAAHRGRVVKLMGDGLLVEFSSLVDAVTCAMTWQSDVARAQLASEHGAATAPATPTIAFRIGINLGDVLIDGDDIHGDGVNVAARLEALADPGGICLSGDAWRQVRGRVDADVADEGEQRLKNVAEPVHVYRLAPPAAFPPSEARPAPVAPATDRPCVAVLAFTNMSGDADQGYFADGIAEDIITDLAKIAGLTVISRHSSFRYRGQNPDVRAICRALGASHVVDGSVRRAGDRVRVTAQLIEGGSGAHVWADRFDRTAADIFEMQDEVTRQIVEALKITLTGQEAGRMRVGTDDPVAYDLVLQARAHYRLFTPEGYRAATALFEQALARDPHYAEPLAGLAGIHMQHWFMGERDGLDRARELAARAEAIDPNSPAVLEALTTVHLFSRRHDEALAAIDRWLAIEPNSPDAHASRAGVLHYAGRHDEVRDEIAKAVRANPFAPFYYDFYIAMAETMMGRFAEAAALLERVKAQNPQAMPVHAFRVACHGHLGDQDAADQARADLFAVAPNFTVAWLETFEPYRYDADRAVLLDGLRKAGLED